MIDGMDKLAESCGALYTLSEAEALEKEAAEKDPKAAVRNRGTVCVPASSSKDGADHFPINDIGQARNALARVHQYSSVPAWYKGSLKGLQDLVSRKVHSKFPSIGKETKKKSSLEETAEALLNKTAQAAPVPNQGSWNIDLDQLRKAVQVLKSLASQEPDLVAALQRVEAKIPKSASASAASQSLKLGDLAEALFDKHAQQQSAQMQALQAKMNATLQPFGYCVLPGGEVSVMPEEKVVDVPVKALPQARFHSGNQTAELRKILAPLVPGMSVNPTVSWG